MKTVTSKEDNDKLIIGNINTSFFSKAFGRIVRTKKGSYLVESAITLPLFLIAVIVMSSVVLMYACIEDCTFITANELRRGAAEAAVADTSALIPFRVKRNCMDDHSRVASVRTSDYGYRTSRWGQDELIALTVRLRLESPNPIGINSKADYELSLVTRAYVGKIRNVEAMTVSEMSGEDAEPVYIFPKRGERYHSKGCSFLKAASCSATLTTSIRRKYSACPLCGSRNASYGSLVYYFPAAGESYHLPGCSSLSRNYIEIDKKDAVARGYSPCSKCGG